MQIWRSLEASGSDFQGGVVTIGNFDGLHLGHQTLFNRAAGLGQPVVVITFEPHPMQILHPERQLQRLLPREDLLEQLPHFAVDLLLMVNFDRALASLSALEFLNTYVRDAFSPRHMVAGYDFAFGSGRTGTLEMLKSWCTNLKIQLHVMPALQVGLHAAAGGEMKKETVSSRRIRELLEQGEVGFVNQLLGREFYLRGSVVRGAGRGGSIGVPTLNQDVINEIIPKQGVYATRTVHAGQSYPSVTNIGTNPTFESGAKVKVETHILDRQIEWPPLSLDVQLLERLRDERKFHSVQELQAQIQRDIMAARKVHSRGAAHE